MMIAAVWEDPDSIIEAAEDVGAGKLTIFAKMILPLSIKDVVVAATFVFHVKRQLLYHTVFDGRKCAEDAGHRPV